MRVGSPRMWSARACSPARSTSAAEARYIHEDAAARATAASSQPRDLREICMADVTSSAPSQGDSTTGGSLPVRFLRATDLDTRMLGMLAALALIWLGFHIASGGLFLTPRNLWNLSVQSASVAIMSTGMVLVIVTRNIDLSVGSLLGFLGMVDRKSTRLNSSHVKISYAVFCS